MQRLPRQQQGVCVLLAFLPGIVTWQPDSGGLSESSESSYERQSTCSATYRCNLHLLAYLLQVECVSCGGQGRLSRGGCAVGRMRREGSRAVGRVPVQIGWILGHTVAFCLLQAASNQDLFRTALLMKQATARLSFDFSLTS